MRSVFVPFSSWVLLACGPNKQTSWPQPPSDGGVGAPSSDAAAAADTIEPGIAQIAARVAADMQPEGAFVRQKVLPGQHLRVDITLKGDECYTIIALAGAGVSDLDMQMLYKDPTSGQLAPIAQDQQNDQSALLGVPPTPICPPKSSDIVLDLSAKQGGGDVGMRLFSKANPQLKPPVPTNDPTEDLMKKNAALYAKGMSAEGSPMTHALTEKDTFNFTVTLTAGKCYSVIAVSPKDAVADLDMKMMMPPFFTMEVDHDKRTDNVAVVGPQCPITIFPVPYRVDITAKKGSGQVMVQLFSKTK